MNKLQLFVMWLDGYMEDKTSLNEAETKKVADKLNGLFEHEAKSEPEESGEIGIPNPDYSSEPWNLRPNDDEVKYRC